MNNRKFMLISLTFIACFYTILTGLMSFYYDMWNRRIEHYWWLKVYAILINLLLLVSTPIYFRCDIMNAEPVDSNDIVYLAMCLNTVLAMSLVTYTILFRWKRERSIIALTLEFRRLELQYFDKWSKNNEKMRFLNRLLYVKMLVMLYQTMINYADTEHLADNNNIASIMCVFYEVGRVSITNGIIFQYFMGLWHICARYNSNNLNLRYLVVKLSKFGNSAVFMSNLRTLLAAHNELSKLVYLLNETFKYDCLGMLLMYFSNNILIGYYAVFYTVGRIDVDNISEVLLEFFFYIATMVDMLILVWICDFILKAYEETSTILQQLTALSPTDVRLNRICERFYLRSACNKLRISIFGTFDINRSNGFATISCIMLYTIFLVQNDYKNLIDYED